MQMAMSAVWTHRFRSLLTILGIVIGITTVVTVSSLLTGLRQGVVDFFQELGPDNIFLYKTSGDPNAPDQQIPPKERKRRAMWAYASQIPPLEQDHALTARMEGRVPEQFWRLAPPPAGWEALADFI